MRVANTSDRSYLAGAHHEGGCDMLMNRIETWTVNSPVRAFVQHFVEARYFERRGGRLEGGAALEIGCGRGEGTRILIDRFGAERVVGIDLDLSQIARAQRRLPAKYQGRVEFRVGDAARLDFPDGSFDAVFDFGILHHLPNWRRAIAEAHRVLKPNGRFYFDEVLRGFLETRAARTFFRHPEDGHFTAAEFTEACAASGLHLLGAPVLVGSWFMLGAAVRDG
jgi:ubiquinone/menaquinone biosynthesis C-methylase UbiE